MHPYFFSLPACEPKSKWRSLNSRRVNHQGHILMLLRKCHIRWEQTEPIPSLFVLHLRQRHYAFAHYTTNFISLLYYDQFLCPSRSIPSRPSSQPRSLSSSVQPNSLNNTCGTTYSSGNQGASLFVRHDAIHASSVP